MQDDISIPAARAWSTAVVADDGTRLRLYRLPGGADRATAVVVGHCNGFAAGAYLPLLERLASLAEVFAFDQRGHGGADRPDPDSPGAYAPDRLARDVAAIVDAAAGLRGGPLVYIGHSLSAASMLRLAACDRARYEALPLRAVTLIEPPVFPDATHPLHDECARSTEDLIARTRRRRTRWPDVDTYKNALLRYPAFASFAPEMLDAMAAATLRPCPEGVELACDPRIEAAIFATWGRPVLYPSLADASAARPLHLVGADPRAQGSDWVAAMMPSVAARIPSARFTMIERRGHLWPFEAPTEMCDWVANTLLG